MKLKILPPAVFLIFILCMWTLHLILPLKVLIPRPWNLIGILFIFDGLSAVVWAAALFKKHQTAIKPFDEPVELVMEGPYKVTRNPMYLGMAVILMGVAIILGSISPIFLPFIFIKIVSDSFIVTEEENLERAFGQNYLDYQEEVPRWL